MTLRTFFTLAAAACACAGPAARAEITDLAGNAVLAAPAPSPNETYFLAASPIRDLLGNIVSISAVPAPNESFVLAGANTVAGAPVIGTATAGDASATIAFTAPASDGGSAITSYTVTSSPGGLTATGPGSPLTVTGLTNGTSYTFTVVATNAVGNSTASAASNAVTPVASNANLSALGVSAGTLSPAFSSGGVSYLVTVPSSVATFTVTPVTADANATVTVNGGAPGSSTNLSIGANTVTLVVTAQDAVTTKTYTVTVTRQTVYQTWAAATGANTNPSVDTDGDGVTDLLEFAFGTDPVDSNSGPLPLQYTGTVASGFTLVRFGQIAPVSELGALEEHLRVLYSRRKDAALAGLTYSQQYSNDLVTWEPSAAAPIVLADNGTYETVCLVDTATLGTEPGRRFFRLIITLGE